MTASVPDAKTWSIGSGALPPGIAIDASTGLISGTPTTAGTYDFTVFAKVNADMRSDTKALAIVVRDPLRILGAEPFTAARRAKGEVRSAVRFVAHCGGRFGTYAWTVSTGYAAARPRSRRRGDLGDAEGRRLVCLHRDGNRRRGSHGPLSGSDRRRGEVAITTALFRPAKFGKLYGAKLKTFGGVKPTSWRITAASCREAFASRGRSACLPGRPRSRAATA